MTKSTKPKTYTVPIRIYYEDTDAGGIVYHANYLKFAERGRTEMLRSTGYNHQQVLKDHKLILVVRHVEIGYKAPARLDDLLEVDTVLTDCGNTSITMQQTIRCGTKTLADMKVVIVAISPEGKPLRLPPQLRQIFCP